MEFVEERKIVNRCRMEFLEGRKKINFALLRKPLVVFDALPPITDLRSYELL